MRSVDEATIYAVANVLKNHPDARIRIVSYADKDRDGDDYESLPLQRAASIINALETAGVEESRLEAAAGRVPGKGAQLS